MPVFDVPGFRNLMSRNRFLSILLNLHCCNNSQDRRDDQRRDRLFKIRPLMSRLIKAWQEAYYPNREICLYESMIAFKECAFVTVYQQKKPHKWGMQAWFLADARTGCCYNLDIYSGKETDTGDQNINKTHHVVMNMASPCNDVGHHLYFDNYYTSPAVIADLALKHFGACGTLRANRKEVPQAIAKAKLKAGMDPVFVRQNDVLYISWFDKRQMNLATNLNDESIFT